jgi:hypothetical protein
LLIADFRLPIFPPRRADRRLLMDIGGSCRTAFQSSIGNQQSAISNQQSTIGNSPASRAAETSKEKPWPTAWAADQGFICGGSDIPLRAECRSALPKQQSG